MYGNFVHATNDAIHYTKPPTISVLRTRGRVRSLENTGVWRSIVQTATLCKTDCELTAQFIP